MSLRCFSSPSTRRTLQVLRHRPSVTSPSATLSYALDSNFRMAPPNKRYYQTDAAASEKTKLLEISKPTVDIAKQMPVAMSEMDNETLVTIAALGDFFARCEVLKRHIMAKDEIEYDDACLVFDKIADSNRGAINLAVYPYFIGIFAGMAGAFGALPLVFDLNTALWFNEGYVTTDVPEPRDLETMLEVGSWTWNWMEPPLGTFSFALLCLQFARAQIKNLGLHPYTTKVINKRADRLAAAYPHYDSHVIKQFSKADPLVHDLF